LINQESIETIDIEIKKELVAHLVIKVLYNRFLSFPQNDGTVVRNAPFHEAFLNAFSNKIDSKSGFDNIPFLISLSSWLHGLNTTLGQTFFEGTAHILSDGIKRTFNSNDFFVFEEQKKEVHEIITDLKNGTCLPDLDSENERILKRNERTTKTSITGFTVDVLFEDEEKICAIEMKSVRPNSGEIKGEKTKILEAKAALKNKFPNKKIHYFMGFPFDPTSDNPTGSDKSKFLDYLIEAKKFLDPKEILIADELWRFLSNGKINMLNILNIINDIATPDFMKNYQIINNTDDDCHKAEIFDSWNLKTEKELLLLKGEMQKNTLFFNEFKRAIYAPPFKANAEYNSKKFLVLKEWEKLQRS